MSRCFCFDRPAAHIKISLLVDSKGGAFLADWEITLTQFTFNEGIDPNSFTIGVALRTLTLASFP